MQSQHPDVGERRASLKAGVPFRRSCVAVLVFYLTAALLNGRALHEKASHKAYGPLRTMWTGATAPWRWAATTLGVDRFRVFFENVLEDEP